MLLARVSYLVVLAGSTMAVLGAFRTGVSWDEPFHVMRLNNYFDHGWFALDWAVDGDKAASGDSNTLVYGPVTMLLLHGLGVLTGVESWGTVGTTPAAYDVHHLGVVLIGLVGTAAAAGITTVLTRSRRWGAFTAAALLALPMWTGHLMFNIKDVPVATGSTLVTLALVTMVSPVAGRRWLRVTCLAAGCLLMIGTRPGMIAALAASLVVLGVGLAVQQRIFGRFGTRRSTLVEVGSGLVLAAAVLVVVYPNVFLRPWKLVTSAEQSANFRDGRDVTAAYIPFHVLAQVPLLLLVFSMIGLVTAFGFVRSGWDADTSHATRLTLVGAQLLALPVVAVLRNSDLYNGLRQLLFATPAWAVLVALGCARVLGWAREKGRVRVVGAVTLVALAAPVLDQVTLFPYQYTYYNVAMDATGIRVPSDYWRVSAPELLADIPTDAQVVCGPTRSSQLGDLAGSPGADGVDPEAMRAGRYSSDSSVDCRTDPLGPLAPAWKAHGLPVTQTQPHDVFYALVDRGHPVPTNCTRLDAVTRERHLRTITMTYVAKCFQGAPELGSETVTLRRDALDVGMLPALWAYAPQGWVMRTSTVGLDAATGSPTLAFRAGESCRTGCRLVMGATAPVGLTAALDGTPVPLEVGTTSTTVRLPPGTDAAWLTFRVPRSRPLHVRSLRIEEGVAP